MDSIFAHFTEPNNPFILFGTVHLTVSAVLAVIGFLLVRQGMKANESSRRRIRVGMALVFLFFEIEWQVWHLWHGVWSTDINLPLHLCSVMIWVSMYGLWFEDRRVYGLIYFLGIAGAIQAIITPNANETFPHIRFISTMITHSLLVVGGFWVVFVEKYRPTFKSALNAFLGLNAYAFVVYFINKAVGSNYLYVVDKPSVATVMDYFPEWPWYIPILEGILIVLMALMLLPFRRAKKAN
ncbi:MAG: TIGR02206 family membrane protein [Bacteroidetes bacterium]|nr:TIGR02206 family membrane protein [Bacteroidota bacterium]